MEFPQMDVTVGKKYLLKLGQHFRYMRVICIIQNLNYALFSVSAVTMGIFPIRYVVLEIGCYLALA